MVEQPAGAAEVADAGPDVAEQLTPVCLDPAEIAFAFDTPAMFRDVESGRELYVDPAAARAEYRRRFSAHAAEVERACLDLGIEFSSLTTERPLELILFDLLKARMRRGRLPGRRASRGGPR